MANSRMSGGVEAFFEADNPWKTAYAKLRTILLDCGLAEELKWGKPCYTYENNNVVLIHGFKDYCALLFIKGALLKDSEAILVQQTENVQAARQIRFTSAEQVDGLQEAIKTYVQEAIEVEKAGLGIEFKPSTEYAMPVEFQVKLTSDPALSAAFEALTPGRQKGYLLYFSSPKQAKTREARVEKCISQILIGKGLDD